VISVFEETGLAQAVESVHQMVEEGELELAKEEVEELVDGVRERAVLVKELAGEIDEMSDDKNVGADRLAKEIEGLAEKDKSDFGKELEALAKDLKGMDKQEAIDHIKDFIDEHSRQLGALKDVEKLLDNWDKLSQKQIAGALKDISKELTKEMTSLEKSAGELQKLVAVPEDFIKKAKKIFSEDSEMLDTIRRKWIGAVIDFTKEKLLQSGEKKDKRETDFWKDAFVKTNKMRDKTIDDFNRSLAELMKGRSKDLQAARARADESIVDHIRKAADAIAGGRYSERLDEISKMAEKESMKAPLTRLASELHEISKRAEALLQKMEKGDLKGILDELGRPDGSTGLVGRVMIRTVDRNRCKAKREMIKELLGSINMISGASRMAEGIQKAMERKDYAIVDEMCQELRTGIRSMKQADREISAILGAKRMPRKARRNCIAKVFAKLIFVKKARPANS
jgi:iron-sulfur cluster repair protein YtfE (RIC family)